MVFIEKSLTFCDFSLTLYAESDKILLICFLKNALTETSTLSHTLSESCRSVQGSKSRKCGIHSRAASPKKCFGRGGRVRPIKRGGDLFPTRPPLAVNLRWYCDFRPLADPAGGCFFSIPKGD